MRTAAEDHELNGVSIPKGATVVLWFPSGSRDETVFPDAHSMRLDRKNGSRHTSFGTGIHICLGLHLARKEITAFLQELATRVDRIELAGEAAWSQSAFVSGIKSLPVTVVPR